MKNPAREFGHKCAQGEENVSNINRRLGKKNWSTPCFPKWGINSQWAVWCFYLQSELFLGGGQEKVQCRSQRLTVSLCCSQVHMPEGQGLPEREQIPGLVYGWGWSPVILRVWRTDMNCRMKKKPESMPWRSKSESMTMMLVSSD